MTKQEAKKECAFCGNPAAKVKKLIAGPTCMICDECVEVCVKILIDEGVKIRYLPPVEKLDITKELGIKPGFKKMNFNQIRGQCFYLCPFAEPFNSVYTDCVIPTVKGVQLTIKRADEIFGAQPIIEDIWEGICESEIVIADVTGRNPNVMYEIGIAHTIGKPVLILTQSIDDVPFDLKHYRCIVYSYTPKGVKELESRLSGTLQFVYNSISKK
jgi:hypothetical protein